ncbi:MAG: hypothetical protein WB555_26705, partial [Candidatus Korobacteraceae bacterium]
YPGARRVCGAKLPAYSHLQGCAGFSILYGDFRKLKKTGSLALYPSSIKSILCDKVFGFNTRDFFEVSL